MIHDPTGNTLTVAVRVTHPAFVLLDPSEQNRRVTAWGRVLATICRSGRISALQVLSAMRSSGKTLAELTEELTLYPQELINVKTAPGFDWQSHEGLKAACREVEAELGDQGRILVRASGTEPLLRLMVEAREPEMARQLAKRLADSLQA